MSNGVMPVATAAAPPVAAAGASDVEWVVGAAVDRVGTLVVGEEFSHVGAPDQDGAGGAQAPHHRAVVGRPVVGEQLGAHGDGHAGHLVAVFQRERHTVQRAPA